MTATVLSGPERRRRWTRAEKLRLIEETLAPEATVAEVARRYDVHPNLLHSWRRQAQQGVLTGGAGASPAPADATDFAAVAIEPPVPSLPASGRTAAGSIDRDRVCGWRADADHRTGRELDGVSSDPLVGEE